MKEYYGDYYSILHVSVKASNDKIKSAYRRLALKWHPDRNKNPEAEDTFKRINRAYEILGDSIKRSQYDTERNFSQYEKVKPKQSTPQEETSPSTVKTEAKKESYTTNNNSWFSAKGAVIIFVLIIFSSLFGGQDNSSNNTPTSNTIIYISPSPTNYPTDYSTIEVITPTFIPTIRISTPTPTTHIEPTIDCTGPDGKHLFVTKKVCDDFNDAWKTKVTPSTTIKTTDACGTCPENSKCSYSTCICNDGYEKNYSTNKCDPCPSNSHGSYGSCTCNSDYQKNYSNNQCESCPENSHGSNGSCTCNDGYEKNYSTNKCVPCPSNSHGSYGSCTCNDGFQKNYSSNQCDPCPSNSHGSYGSCTCDSGYTKNYTSGQCDRI